MTSFCMLTASINMTAIKLALSLEPFIGVTQHPWYPGKAYKCTVKVVMTVSAEKLACPAVWNSEFCTSYVKF